MLTFYLKIVLELSTPFAYVHDVKKILTPLLEYVSVTIICLNSAFAHKMLGFLFML